MKKKSVLAICSLLAVFAVVGTLVAGSAEAKSKPVPRLAFYGDIMQTHGYNAGCRGAIRVTLRSDDRKPGMMRLTLRSDGFTGNGAAWRKNPQCKVGIRFKWALPTERSKLFHLKGTRQRGKLMLDTQIRIGSGLNLVGVVSTNPISRGVSYYTVIR